MRELGLVYGVLVGQMISFVVVSWVAARAVGALITEVGLGMPALLAVRRAAPRIRVGPIPGAYVELLGRVDHDHDHDPRSWRRRPLAARLVVLLAPWACALAVAVACLGPAPALRTFARGFDQILFTVDVTPLVRALLDVAAHAPLHDTVGIVFAKLTAMNLLPLGGLAGSGLLQELATRDGQPPPRALQAWITTTMLVTLVWIGGRFGWAVIQVLRD